jgi:glycosyltransferase involved in cell wall biosynthesis
MIKVSVVVATYNHADLIDEALASVFAQETDFETEVIISEDASTDGTRQIVERWRARFPDKTRLLLSDRNLHSNEVIRRGFHAARGDYVALIDGDDYWLSPHKLANQAALLDRDPSVSLCFHNARVSSGQTRFGDLWTNPTLGPRLTLADLWEGNPFPTCGGMFRRSALPRIPDWYRDLNPMITDWPLYLLFAEHGDILFVPEAWGVYRLHSGGLYSPQTARSKLALMDALYRRVNEGMAGRHDASLKRGHHRYFVGMAHDFLDQGHPDLALAAVGYAWRYRTRFAVRRQLSLLRLATRARLASTLAS